MRKTTIYEDALTACIITHVLNASEETLMNELERATIGMSTSDILIINDDLNYLKGKDACLRAMSDEAAKSINAPDTLRKLFHTAKLIAAALKLKDFRAE